MRKHFPDKFLTRVLNRTKANPLTFFQLVVYSHLVYRAGYKKGATATGLSRATGLDRQKTVPPALEVLRGHGLAEKRGTRWHALEPAGEACRWFAPRKDAPADAAWHGRFSYWWLARGTATCPLTPMQLAVYCKMGSIPKARRTQALVCTLLNMDAKTVRTAVARLREIELMNPVKLLVLPPTGRQMDWFLDAKPPPQPLRLADLLDMTAFGDLAPSMEKLFATLLGLFKEANYGDGQVRGYFEWAFEQVRYVPAAIEELLREVKLMLDDAERDHRVNRRKGKYTTTINSAGLLKFETRRYMADLRKRYNVR
jgi:hypothetical protein